MALLISSNNGLGGTVIQRITLPVQLYVSTTTHRISHRVIPHRERERKETRSRIPTVISSKERCEYQFAIRGIRAAKGREENHVPEIWPAAKPKSLILGTYRPLPSFSFPRTAGRYVRSVYTILNNFALPLPSE